MMMEMLASALKGVYDALMKDIEEEFTCVNSTQHQSVVFVFSLQLYRALFSQLQIKR